MPKIVILTGKLEGQKLTLPERQLIIGREESCHIRITGTEISRRHCSLRVVGEKVFVMDLGSRNGSLINDVPVKVETELQPGDILRVGSMLFQLEGPKVKAVVPKPKAPSKTASPSVSGSGMVDVKLTSEDSIVNWLCEDAPVGGTGDSTIVARSAVDETVKMLPKKQFTTVKDEAADIIRRHLELVRG